MCNVWESTIWPFIQRKLRHLLRRNFGLAYNYFFFDSSSIMWFLIEEIVSFLMFLVLFKLSVGSIRSPRLLKFDDLKHVRLCWILMNLRSCATFSCNVQNSFDYNSQFCDLKLPISLNFSKNKISGYPFRNVMIFIHSFWDVRGH